MPSTSYTHSPKPFNVNYAISIQKKKSLQKLLKFSAFWLIHHHVYFAFLWKNISKNYGWFMTEFSIITIILLLWHFLLLSLHRHFYLLLDNLLYLVYDVFLISKIYPNFYYDIIIQGNIAYLRTSTRTSIRKHKMSG